MIDSIFFEKLKSILFDIWYVASFQASYADYDFFIFLWVVFLYIFLAFFIIYIFKELVNVIVKFLINPLTLLFILLFLCLIVWTITKIDNYRLKSDMIDEDNTSINLLPEKVKIEELDKIHSNKDNNTLDFDDPTIKLFLKQIDTLKEEIKKRRQSITEMKNN